MFKFIDFEWLLKLTYYVAKVSGFFFISIDFDSMQMKFHVWDYLIMAASFGMHFIGIDRETKVPITTVSRSKLIMIGVKFIVFFTARVTV